MSFPFDASEYVRPPVVNVASGFALGSALLAACPKGAGPELRRAAKRLRSSVLALQTGWIQRDKAAPPQDRRAFDQRVDVGWGALYGRIESYSWLPADPYPNAARAATLLKTLFTDGLGFLKLPYNEEWSESEKRLRRIDDDKLAADIDRIAGPEFLKEVRAAHELYGKALGMTGALAVADDVKLAAPLRKVQEAIVNYSIKLLAIIDDDDPASLVLVRNALAPIDEHRASMNRRAATGEEPAPVDPNTPVPDLPATPT